jgi:TolB-like protein/Tfp pilus assembly protein PilF
VAIAYGALAWLLVQVAETVLPVYGVSDESLRLLFTLLGIGFVLALVLSWAFELTPEGLKRESEVDRTASITPQTGKKLDRIIMVVLALALGFFAFDKFVLDPARDAEELSAAREEAAAAALEYHAPDRSIAVLPFVNMSGDADNEFFSDGVAEELLNLLAKVEGLAVVSRTSSFYFKNKDVDIKQIAERLKVRHVLEGSVRRAGDQVRVTAQLIDTRTDTHLWSENYDRELKDIFAVQDEIALAIVGELQQRIGPDAVLGKPVGLSQTANVDAYQLYLRGIGLLRLRGIDNINASIEFFEQAVALDPDYARAWSQLATAYSLVPFYSFEERPPWMNKAREAAERALVLDESLAGPNATLANVTMVLEDGNWAQVELWYRRGIEADPKHVLTRQWFGEFLMHVGKVRLMLEQFEMAHQLDPLSPVVNSALAWGYLYNGNFEQAERFAKTALELGMGGTWAEDTLGLVYLYQQRYDDALAIFSRDHRDFELNRLVVKAIADPSLAPDAVAAIEAVDYPRISYWSVDLMMLLGETDRALDSTLEQAREGVGDSRSLWRPHFLKHARDPRFIETLELKGYPSYFETTGWADFCRPEDQGFSCDAAYYAENR